MRKTTPDIIYRIWDNIKLLKKKRQQVNINNILKEINKTRFGNITYNALQISLNHMVKDSFLKLDNSKSLQDNISIYDIPILTDKIEYALLDRNDWYCYECHAPGAIINCEQCFRVFHLNCKPKYVDLKHLVNNVNGDLNENKNNQLCKICLLMRMGSMEMPENLKCEELNYLLNLRYGYHRTWLAKDTFSSLASNNGFPIKKDDFLIFKKLFFKNPKTLDDIAQKLKGNEYTLFVELICDLMDIQHCIAILRGTDSDDYEASTYLFKAMLIEIDEIKLCKDCYRHSYEKLNEHWFALPCTKNHDLVYAKQYRYPYWPAKVLRILGNKYEVRFFGRHHTRCKINENKIKSIDTDLNLLNTAKNMSIGFDKAMMELGKHQQLLAEKATTVKSKEITTNENGAIKEEQDCATQNNKKYDDELDIIDGNDINNNHKSASSTQMKKMKRKYPVENVIDLLSQKLDENNVQEDIKKLVVNVFNYENSRFQKQIEHIRKSYDAKIRKIKAIQWCTLCRKPAQYYCCFNTSYCSLKCQHLHRNEHRECNNSRTNKAADTDTTNNAMDMN